jgi:chloramphenicol O-acetyltransferase type A
MRYIDMETWPRRKHFEVFSALDDPFTGLCADVDLTRLYSAVKQSGHTMTVAIVYVLARAANAIPEFRYRIRGAHVVEHEIVHPSPTVLVSEDLFSFCSLDYTEDFSEFAARAEEKIAYVKENPTLEDEPGQDDLLYLSAIPWVSFTSVKHAMHLDPVDSVPRIAWGKFFEEGESMKMPLDVQVHHGLVDGLHMGRFYAEVQDLMDHPDFLGVEA